MIELQEKQHARFKAEAEENARLLKQYQEILDRPAYQAKLKRLQDAEKQMRKDSADIERTEMIRRGVLRGRRGR